MLRSGTRDAGERVAEIRRAHRLPVGTRAFG
jgi:hypothetical protein